MSDVQTVDLRPGAVNFEAYQGDDFTRTVTVRNAAGVGYALTTAKMQIKTLGGTLAQTLTDGTGITITNPGSLTLTIAKADMALLPATSYRYDLQVTLTATSEQRTLLAGIFNVNAETTT